MKLKSFCIAFCQLFWMMPIFSQPKLVDVTSKEQIAKMMQNEMVTVIPAGKKVNITDFAGYSGTQSINAYQIAKHEVTQELYLAIMGENPSHFKDEAAEGDVQEKRPVESVSWYDAVYFCNKLSMIMGLTPAYSIDGQTDPDKWTYRAGMTVCYDFTSKIICNYSVNGFRLPTYAEWEMAVRGGLAGGWNYKYSGSDNIDDVAWYENNSDYKTHEVVKKKPNALGLYDMNGNVCECCDSDYEPYSFGRGGCYRDYDENTRDSSIVGFRVVRKAQ